MQLKDRGIRRRHIPGRRTLYVVCALVVPTLLLIDLASVALVKLSASDDATEAARAGMSAIQFSQTATPAGAEAAFRAANEVADLHDLTIDSADFTIYADGAVQLTARRTAPTLLFKHLPVLRDLVEAEVSTTVERPRY
ncbi:MAG: hypothetical protein ACT4P1_12230 [Sporichthyaceae bacterium]